jgi:hypothetical protein
MIDSSRTSDSSVRIGVFNGSKEKSAENAARHSVR